MNGIITGCDRNQEWLLPWWYEQIREHHPDLPIAFADMGISDTAKRWCSDRGILIPESQIDPLSPFPQEIGWLYQKKKWKCKGCPPIPNDISFRKPLIMQQSPFERSLWLDLDCQVVGNLTPLFSMKLPPTKLAVRSSAALFEMESIDECEKMNVASCNSGVILFEKESYLLHFWCHLVQQARNSFCVDDQLLAFAIHKYLVPVGEFSLKNNWLSRWGLNKNAVIIHWAGAEEKNVLWLYRKELKP